MSESAVALLPASGDASKWNDQEKALVEAAGLVKRERNGNATLADRPTVEAFLMHCKRTGLDPIGRQIYAINRAGKWQIQVSIDGARLVAERSGKYEGQTAAQWSDDGRTWYDAWVAQSPDDHPRFARVGVYKTGFREALTVVARWESYAVYDDVWENGRKTGKKKLSSMWQKMPDLMLAKVAEMLALRKAFPQDLSGLYSTEEMQQADSRPTASPTPARREESSEQPAQAAPPVEVREEPKPSRDWVALANKYRTVDDLRALDGLAQGAGERGVKVSGEPNAPTVGQFIRFRANQVAQAPTADARTGEVVDAEVVPDEGEPVASWEAREPGSGLTGADPESEAF